jgi:hypothetical protein
MLMVGDWQRDAARLTKAQLRRIAEQLRVIGAELVEAGEALERYGEAKGWPSPRPDR